MYTIDGGVICITVFQSIHAESKTNGMYYMNGEEIIWSEDLKMRVV